MTPSQQILAIAASGTHNPVWPEALHQAVRVMGYTDYTIEDLHAHPTKPEICFSINYGFHGEGCADDHAIPFSVFNDPHVAQEMERHLTWARLQEAQAHVQDLERQLAGARQECDKAQQAFQEQMALYGHEEVP